MNGEVFLICDSVIFIQIKMNDSFFLESFAFHSYLVWCDVIKSVKRVMNIWNRFKRGNFFHVSEFVNPQSHFSSFGFRGNFNTYMLSILFRVVNKNLQITQIHYIFVHFTINPVSGAYLIKLLYQNSVKRSTAWVWFIFDLWTWRSKVFAA